MRTIIKIKFITGIIIIVLAILSTQESKAQLSSFHSGYFQNEYLLNPAMAGLSKGLNINLGYQRQWSTITGGPKLQNLTADYNAEDSKVGLGININADQAGLISRNRVMATFAYHIPVSETGKVNLGLSFGIDDTFIDYSKIQGDQSDPEAAVFNERRIYVDGDFGASFTNGNLTLQGTVPNLKSTFFPDQYQNLEVDRSTFFTAAGYKFKVDNEYNNFTVEPKVSFRGVKGFDNILDAGVNMVMNNYNFGISGMYHSNKTFTAGLGLNLQTTDIIFAYTYNTGPLQTFANNTFEFGVKLKLFR